MSAPSRNPQAPPRGEQAPPRGAQAGAHRLPEPGSLALPAPPRPSLATDRTRERMFWLLAAIPAVPFLLCALLPPLNHDVAAVLNFSGRWLAGERLYSDLIDVNPPLIFVLNLLPAALGEVLPIGAVQAFILCVLALGLGAGMLCWRLLPALALAPLPRAVLLAALPMTMLGAGYDFGQREHLMVLTALPYLLHAALRAEGGSMPARLTLAIALLAAIGFALKPHFLAIPALIELWVFCCLGPRRAFRGLVPWAMAGFWALYLLSLPVLFPAYLTQVVPLVMENYLALGGLNWWQVLATERMLPAFMLLPPLLFWAFRGGPAIARPLALASLGAFIAAWVQHRGWSYHVLPAKLFSGVAMAMLAAHWAGRAMAGPRAERAAAPATLVAALVLSFFHLVGNEAPYRQITWSWSRGGVITEQLRREALGERLLVLSPDIFPVYPALNYGRAQSTLRTMTLWLLQGVYEQCPRNGARYREPWEMSRTEFFVYRTVAEDFARAPPAAILVSDRAGIAACSGREFDLLTYFGRHPLFSEAFSHYRLATEFDGYKLYRRED